MHNTFRYCYFSSSVLDNISAVMHFKLSGKIIFSKGVYEKAQSPITFTFGGIAISIIFVLEKLHLLFLANFWEE